MNDVDGAGSADDPLRADVERWLRAFFAAGWAASGAAVAGVRRCLGSRLGPVADRVAEPMRVVRSVVELVTGAPPARGVGTQPGDPAPAATDDAPESEATTAAADLPIDEYESLAASHVVARLGNLSPGELREVRRFEVAHRGRRTVIGRIDQLLAATGPA